MFFTFIWHFFSQTTSVTRVGGPGGLLKVRVEIDKLGDLKLKISDLFGGRKIIGTATEVLYIYFEAFLLNMPIEFFVSIFLFTENTADFLINNMWRPGFPFVRPLINDLVSTAFTDIFNDSFRHFPIDDYIKNWINSMCFYIVIQYHCK